MFGFNLFLFSDDKIVVYNYIVIVEFLGKFLFLIKCVYWFIEGVLFKRVLEVLNVVVFFKMIK